MGTTGISYAGITFISESLKLRMKTYALKCGNYIMRLLTFVTFFVKDNIYL